MNRATAIESAPGKPSRGRLKVGRKFWMAILLLVCAWTMLMTVPCAAKIYKYQRNGVWYYTDTPPEDLPEGSQEIEENGPGSAASGTAGTPLLTDYPARNAIEQATAATVAVKSSMGYGSGFFISPQGHIITNKHVVRSTSQSNHETESRFKQAEAQIDTYDRQFREERGRLENFKSQLDRLKEQAGAETQADRRQSLQADYEANRQRYEQWAADFDQRLKKYEQEKKRFQEGRQSYDYTKSVADLAQSFTIILADKTELYARLIQVSADHDLALLKLDGYRTPALTPGTPRTLAQSEPVYAIGNPAMLHNSVTSGIFSGFQQGFLQTNAQIYPGNSGGPLVSAEGRVLGVNTFKQLTHKFEGLGFAIPIDTVVAEFRNHLPAR
jgi:S1-C subfamily serine protease